MNRITLHGGGRLMQIAVVASALTVAAFAFAAGAPALIAALTVAGLPFWLAIAGPVVVDAAMIVTAAAMVVRRSHGRPTHAEAVMLIGLVVLSAAVQFLHAWVVTEALELAVRVPAIAVATALPLLVLAGTELAGRAVLVEKVKRGGRATTIATTARPIASTTAQKPTATITPPATATMSLSDAAAAFATGALSQRKAAAAAGVSVDAVRRAAAPLREAIAA